MAKSALERLNNRADHCSVSHLKDRTFAARLKGDYNVEDLSKYGQEDTTFKAIVQMSTYNYSIQSRILDYQKCSIPLEENCAVGDVLYWGRMGKNYIIFADRDTEKNYFLCYMSAADYEIVWVDGSGAAHKQLGSYVSLANERIVTSQGEYEYLDASMQLLLKDTEECRSLDYYDKIYIKGKNWKIVGKSTDAFPGMIALYLKEVPFNAMVDEKSDLQGIEIVTQSVISNLDSTNEVQLGYSSNLTLQTVINGKVYYDSYVVTPLNCTYSSANHIVTFDKVGTATLNVVSSRLGLYPITITVKPAGETATNYEIVGSSALKTMLSYTFTIKQIINGVSEDWTGEWNVGNPALFTSLSAANGSTFTVVCGNTTDTTNITCTVNGTTTITKDIAIKSIY